MRPATVSSSWLGWAFALSGATGCVAEERDHPTLETGATTPASESTGSTESTDASATQGSVDTSPISSSLTSKDSEDTGSDGGSGTAGSPESDPTGTSWADGTDAETGESEPPLPLPTLDPGVIAHIDDVFSAWDQPDSPGCSVAVVQDGAPAYMQGYGVENLHDGKPITPRSVFHLASLSKQFTGASIGLLVLDGVVAMDATIGTYLLSLPDYAQTIRVRHLMYHTSGLREYFIGLFSHPHTNQEVIDFLDTQKLDFATGSAWAYSNTNYVLLAEIVRARAGKRLREFAQEHIFTPLDMRRTEVRDETSSMPNGATKVYELSGGEWLDTTLSIIPFKAHGDQNIWSSAEDMAKWALNFTDPMVGGSALIDLITTSGSLDGDSSAYYAFGLIPEHRAGRPIVLHEGRSFSYNNHAVYFTDRGDAVIVLCNAGDDAWAPTLAGQVLDIVF